jgi:hypothetical protein
VLLRAESERVNVNAGVGGAGVAVERLDKVEVGALTLREAVLTVELELGSDNWVLTPTMEGESSLGKNECASIRNERLSALAIVRSKVGGSVVALATGSVASIRSCLLVPEMLVFILGNIVISSTCQLE